MDQPLRLYIFVGCPGSGKTTISKYIAEQTGAEHLWADHERQKMFGYPSHSKLESDTLYKSLNIRAEELLKAGKSVAYDTNFNYRSDREAMRALADQYHAELKLIWVTTPRQVAKPRALHKTHKDKNGYLVEMSEEVFNHLCDHTEPPAEDEHPIKIDGSDIRLDELLPKLGI